MGINGHLWEDNCRALPQISSIKKPYKEPPSISALIHSSEIEIVRINEH